MFAVVSANTSSMHLCFKHKASSMTLLLKAEANVSRATLKDRQLKLQPIWVQKNPPS